MSTTTFRNYRITAEYVGDKPAPWNDGKHDNYNNHKITVTNTATKARKYLTLGAEYSERATFAKRRYGPSPANVYPAWCHATRQSPCHPFESGRNVLPGMEAFAKGIA